MASLYRGNTKDYLSGMALAPREQKRRALSLNERREGTGVHGKGTFSNLYGTLISRHSAGISTRYSVVSPGAGTA
jgi:hypothetical protein